MSKIALPPASAATDGPRLEDRLRAAGYDVVIADRWSDADLRPLFGDVDVVVASPARSIRWSCSRRPRA